MRGTHIPLNKPCLVGNELRYIEQAIKQNHISGNGEFTGKCEAFLEQALSVKKAFLTTSCTHALEMAALLLNLQPGDEVIVPSFTFVSTVNAFVLRGARPRFVDINPETLNMDEQSLEPLINSRTKVIVPVHYAGTSCQLNRVLEIARNYELSIVEDNAHGLFGKYRGRSLGTFGELATLSFHETKNFNCGEGGALLINDPQYIERAEIIWQKGTNRGRFLRGEVDKYTWVDIGSSYVPSDLLAAYLYAQFEAREKIQAKRQHIWQYYYEHLQSWADEHGVSLPKPPSHCESSYHLFYLLLPSSEERDAMIAHLRERNINSAFHFMPLHLSEMGRRLGANQGDCPVSEVVSDRLLRLPFYNDLTEDDQDRVISAITGAEQYAHASSRGTI